MNASQPLENPELVTNNLDLKVQDKCNNDKGSFSNQMISCSTQVYQDDSFFIESTGKYNKKKKKQQYKKRKKDKKRSQEKSAKIDLAGIIYKIYEGKTCFQDQRNRIQVCLWHLVGGNKFHDFLNQTIKLHVNSIQKQIMDELLKNSCFEQSIQFYLLIIEKIFEKYQELKQSSIDIQRIINLFMKMTSGNQFEETHGLDKSTFRFMIQTNQVIKNIVQKCTYYVSSKHQIQFNHLREIYQFINRQQEYQYEYQGQEYVMQRSTQVDEDEEILQRQKILKPKRKRKRIKQSWFKAQCQDVVRRLNQMIIQDKRIKCNTSQKWLDCLKEKISHLN